MCDELTGGSIDYHRTPPAKTITSDCQQLHFPLSMDSDQDFHVKTLFYQGSYSASHDAISSISNPSFQLVLFSARCLICLNKPEEAIKVLKEYHEAEPAARGLTLLAEFYQDPPSSKAGIDKFGEAAEALIEEIADEENDGPDSVLRVTLATILTLAENLSLAVFILKQGVQLKSLEAVAALIYLYLSPRLRRPDLARNLYISAKAWADDAILLQMAEAWIGATTGSSAGNSNGREPGGYQSAFYVFDEVTNTAVSKPNQINIVGLNGKAITQLAMGHVEEAQANLAEALKADPENENALANSIAISARLEATPSETTTSIEKLRSLNPKHPLIVDLDRQSALFDEAASHFVTSAA
ncbi:hypothetical protein MJO28_004291 [Puccinia striiformis f. sp. tritici]|uniref:Coatomer subunit epsilon n=3 Tax=Puccinia striiformis TaxID=27350 RepID=A0A0L0VEN1_9BASI|nr:hypothetical protein Pst134EA_007112 [Puccinia striiformis f. sp. tritici]KAI9608569.1 hypothetical protein H4Q26_004752 [Puccinia striiformis f. sp. tritici PST-130]KNE97735.1 hypothetical protein PSTG_08954 [Puccinia striiformis f. sp. tritici PST-78]POW06910.1 hypothetical protein PSTT_08605 [Puccinia striiformis]KAH9460047.1 hypothetical protein Pst134EB_008252 [Puccinia striiformis f. sp. tritici]KAH9469836.1 hypothetical protein Pst134EA_007112 [Puccinia striiformis f. sp. tritici]